MPEKIETVKPKPAPRESFDAMRGKLNAGQSVNTPRAEAYKFIRWIEGSTGTPTGYTVTVSGESATFETQP